jgi:hypothetical protein
MRSMICALLAISICSMARAQESTPEMLALSSKVMREVSEGIQCQAASIKLAKENEALRARVKELEAKSTQQK